MPLYKVLPLSVRMSDYGYWIVTLSVAPGKRIDVMIAVTGITPEQAQDHALATFGPALAPRRHA